MIRKYIQDDINQIIQIWLSENIVTHDFIDKEYWIKMLPFVQEALKKAEIYVFYNNDEIKGFIGTNNGYIEGIFVKSEYQSKGIGKQLIETLKHKYSKLYLNVYKKNERGILFYKKQGFVISKSKIDKITNEQEHEMNWTKVS